MRDRQNCGTCELFSDQLLGDLLCNHVNVCSCLIKQHKFAVSQNCS